MKEHYCIFSIFGATGDLTNRKLLPALYFMEQERQLKESFRIVCVARKEKTDEQYKKEASESIRKFSRVKVKDDILEKLLSRINYMQMDFSGLSGYIKLKHLIENISGTNCRQCERIFYLAVPPQLFKIIVDNLKHSKLAEMHESDFAYNRVMFEKPFGSDLKSARKMNNAIIKVFNEKQIYRIDHYMAKELVQNLMVLRFANSIFEPLWNREHIDHIQITVAESIGVGARGEYYDNAGALRDVMQNHLMQLLMLVGMGEPKKFDVEQIRNQKSRVLKSVKKISGKHASWVAVKGQYAGGVVNGRDVASYLDEPEVSKNSKTETYAALKLEIKNNMWKNVPFYLRTGKRLKERATEIVIVYKDVPFGIFKKQNPEKNMMVIRVQPYEGITLQFNAKVPGNKVIIDNVDMDFCHECKFGPNSPEAYEKLLFDAMNGDQTLFTRWDEVEHSWKIMEPLLQSFMDLGPCKYEAGTWGPIEADKLMERDGRKWVAPKRPSYADQLGK